MALGNANKWKMEHPFREEGCSWILPSSTNSPSESEGVLNAPCTITPPQQLPQVTLATVALQQHPAQTPPPPTQEKKNSGHVEWMFPKVGTFSNVADVRR